ncbi:foldase protein PrsA [Staphylococcus massiliensis]|uniref:peptidylprolyl isomerase n=1 Tax=Staphylococcus massiliensis S46 TaxID=1229783 RepID=K9AVF9_9STAP|nr:foldase protein PrsA [Staphylococcus massiliensis]EKU46577.1 putative foldase protein prsA 1 [Staphylococcus massiliensis S46]MCG3399658.1 peptidylprolyl isomerase [Staphylococcus massiliensis]MCG3400762.1 peptidylprolyl isomerase [Staphylococcus massiliensis]MCG3412073.1 peptidylprolyl isomerase [Staphylococcus massiliensis]PNZ99312.1 peptidylprolyl isomerase [Staphylococcus massiliensis CCUG 55927]
MKSIKKIIIPVTASALLLGACGNDSSSSKDSSLITSKAGDVKVQDVMKELGDDKVANASFKILLDKILKDKYEDKVDTKKIEEETKKEMEKYGGEKQFKKMAEQQGMSIDDFKEQKKTQAYQKEMLKDKVDISDKEVKEKTKKASHILIKVDDGKGSEGQKGKEDKGKKLSDKEAKKKAEEIHKKVEKNPDKFADIAKKESMDDASKKKGGSLDYVIKGQMVEDFEKPLFKLKEGEVSDVVKTEFGYHIIKADKADDFDKKKDDLKYQIIQEKVQKDPKLMTDAFKDLLKEYKVDYKDRDLKKAIDESFLDPKKIKEQQQQQQQQQAMQGGMSGGAQGGM